MEANYFTILYWFCHTSTWIHHRHTRVPHPEPPPTSLPVPSLQVIPVHPPQDSYIEPGLVIHFLYDIIHVSMPFPQVIPPSPSPAESKRLFYKGVTITKSIKKLKSLPGNSWQWVALGIWESGAMIWEGYNLLYIVSCFWTQIVMEILTQSPVGGGEGNDNYKYFHLYYLFHLLLFRTKINSSYYNCITNYYKF